MEFFAHPQYCNVEGHKLAYYRAGQGEPLLLVHGITTYSFIWRKVIPFLVPHFDVIAIDLLGCGKSDMPLSVSYSIKTHALRIKALLEDLNLSETHLVTHDVGGGIGQICAAQFPNKWKSLTMINPVGYDYWPVQPIIAMRTPILRLFAMASLDFGVFKIIVKRGLFHKQNLTDELMSHFWMPMKTRAGRKAFLHFARCLDNQDLIEIENQLKQLDLPVLIIRGDADPYLTLSITERLHEDIPQSKFLRISTGAHFIQEDEPEMLADHFQAFLRGLPVHA